MRLRTSSNPGSRIANWIRDNNGQKTFRITSMFPATPNHRESSFLKFKMNQPQQLLVFVNQNHMRCAASSTRMVWANRGAHEEQRVSHRHGRGWPRIQISGSTHASLNQCKQLLGPPPPPATVHRAPSIKLYYQLEAYTSYIISEAYAYSLLGISPCFP